MTQQPIIEPISRELLEQELNKDRFIRTTRKGDNEIYIVNAHNSPNILQEIGRLREVTFREAGGGTGQPVDIDNYDTDPICYEQLIVWDPEEQQIIGGYRFILCRNAIDADGKIHLSTSHYFDFSEKFIKRYLPNTIELGRSWVQPEYQPSVNPRKGLYALDNIWDGLGALARSYPEIEYFFGKVTMYPSYDRMGRDYLLNFMHYYFPDKENLMHPYHPLKLDHESSMVENDLRGIEFKDGFKVLNSYVRNRGEIIPPLINIYMNLSPTMKTFGTAVNPEFGGVEETGILVKLADIYDEKKDRYVNY